MSSEALSQPHIFVSKNPITNHGRFQWCEAWQALMLKILIVGSCIFAHVHQPLSRIPLAGKKATHLEGCVTEELCCI